MMSIRTLTPAEIFSVKTAKMMVLTLIGFLITIIITWYLLEHLYAIIIFFGLWCPAVIATIFVFRAMRYELKKYLICNDDQNNPVATQQLLLGNGCHNCSINKENWHTDSSSVCKNWRVRK